MRESGFYGIISTYEAKNSNEYIEIFNGFRGYLHLPATSATVERVCSVGVAILHPSRRRLSDRILEMLIFLKCNY